MKTYDTDYPKDQNSVMLQGRVSSDGFFPSGSGWGFVLENHSSRTRLMQELDVQIIEGDIPSVPAGETVQVYGWLEGSRDGAEILVQSAADIVPATRKIGG